jgi:hypothetical protein
MLRYDRQEAGVKKAKMENVTYMGTHYGYDGKKAPSIYTVTSIRAVNNRCEHNRCWGWYSNKEDALKAVKSNAGDMNETTYTHIIVEEIPPGVPADATAIKFYEWVGTWETGKWKVCKTPEWAKGVVNFALG